VGPVKNPLQQAVRIVVDKIRNACAGGGVKVHLTLDARSVSNAMNTVVITWGSDFIITSPSK
jgi:hypothetical protein